MIALKDEEIEQLRSIQNKPPEATERLTREEISRILNALGVGKQSPQFKRVASVLKGLGSDELIPGVRR